MFRWSPLLLLLPLLFLGTARAQDDLPRCTCPQGNGCYHFLGAPVVPPDEPSPCPLDDVEPNACERKRPKGWDPVCFDNGKIRCFLRRHAASWKLACSERLAGTCDCRNPHPEWCPSCGRNGADWGREGLDLVAKQVEVERRILGKRRKLILVTSPHFYLVTDIKRLMVVTRERSRRLMGMHEIAHLFIQRAEIAYREFVEAFGDDVILPRPSAIYLMETEALKRAIAEEYFGHGDPELLYGGESTRIAGGYPYNGCAISREKYGEGGRARATEDEWLHFQMRHLVGHLLVSCWVKVNGKNEFLPRWMYAGAGHWLSRNPEKFREMANFCAGEGAVVRHSGKKWPQMLVRQAADPKSHPVQRVFSVGSLGGLDLDMHQRAWSWFDVFLREDRDRFVAFLRALRAGTDARVAMKATFGLTPEEWDGRWRERILRRRESVAPTPEEQDAVDPTRPGAKERADLRAEKDPAILAAKVRALRRVDDPLTAATLLPLLRSESELVQESVVWLLSRTESAEVKRWLRTEGLSGVGGSALANVARIIGEVGDPEAGQALVDRARANAWLARAHVARSIGLVGYERGISVLARLLRDKAPKVRIAAMDALGRFGGKAGEHWEEVAVHLGAGAWQARSAAAECLGKLGEMRAVEPLIDRMEIEEGRLRRDIRAALARITRDDLGNDPANWRSFLERLKKRHGGKLPPRPGEAPPPPEGEIEYGPEPTYYGLRVFSRSVGYVVDTSASMIYKLKIDPAWLKKRRREYPPNATKFDLAKSEIAASLGTLDPRVRINLFFFRTEASAWKSKAVPASPKNVGSAVSRLETQRPGDGFGQKSRRTNYVDAFRLVLGAKRGEPQPAGFPETPDTIYFLTDGKPTVGDITEPEILLSWFQERNRFARIRVHVITFGRLEMNENLLRPLAEANGGRFVQVPEAE